MKKRKRFVGLLLAAIMLFGFLPPLLTVVDASSKLDLLWPVWNYQKVNGKYVATSCQINSNELIQHRNDYSKGVITSYYGYDSSTYNGRIHPAIDIGKSVSNTVVVAVADGDVERVNYNSRWGHYIWIKLKDEKYNGEAVYVGYHHLRKAPFITSGPVKQGDVLGFVGNTGISSGVHLDFRITYNHRVEKGGTDIYSPKRNYRNGEMPSDFADKYAYFLDPVNDVNYSFEKHTCKSWTNTGVCTSCGKSYLETAAYDNDRVLFKGALTPSTGSFFLLGDYSEFRALPYDASLKLPFKAAGKPAPSIVQITPAAKVKNHYGNVWYECWISSSLTTTPLKAYIYSSYVNTDKAQIKNDISTSNVAAPPSTLTYGGNGHHIYGTVNSGNRLSSVTLGVYLASSGAATAQVKTISNINAKSYDLHQNDYDIYFSRLPVGDYLFKISATDIHGGKYSEQHAFSVRAKNTPVYTVRILNTYSSSSSSGSGGEIKRTVTSGSSLNLGSLAQPSRLGYDFIGWATDADATTAEYGASETIKPNNNLNLYAVYRPIAPPTATNLTAKQMDIGVGGEATIGWWQSSRADKYVVEYLREDDSVYFTATTKATSASTVIDTSGNYTVRVKAVNYNGESEWSPKASITVHEPSTVSFLDYNGTLTSSQKVDYGKNAVAPASPSRAGYTFKRWEGSLTSVTADRTLTAQYEPIEYSVTFFDYNGAEVGTQTVRYDGDTPGSASAPEASLLHIPEGYVFGTDISPGMEKEIQEAKRLKKPIQYFSEEVH